MASMFPLLLPSVLFLGVLTPIVSANNYCRISPKHIMCLYRANQLGSTCPKGAKIVPVDANDKTTIVKLHNELRRKVAMGLEKKGRQGRQPSASDMIELKWDNELATLAQTWANQCPETHPSDEPKFPNSVQRFPGNNLGQNMGNSKGYSASYKVKNWPRAINSWYNEVNDMEPWILSKYPEKAPAMIGHYTQIVWATVKFIGCGAVHFKDRNGQDVFKYVCNYGPLGNIIDYPVYKMGTPASKCPKGTSAIKGLCHF